MIDFISTSYRRRARYRDETEISNIKELTWIKGIL